MAKTKDNTPNPLLSAINQIQSTNPDLKPEVFDSNIVDIMEFCDGEIYLNLPNSNFNLFKSQRIILKCFYMGSRGNEDLRLDKEEWEWLHKGIEQEELDDVKYETNIQDVINKMMAKEKEPQNGSLNFNELHLVMGRRGTKCRWEEDLISTTEGSLTFRDLCDRTNNGEEIGICTYDMESLKRSVTYDIKARDNGLVDCFELETKRGIRETSSWNHPYLVWRDEWEKPQFVFLKDLCLGDKIAVADRTELFGHGSVGTNKAALLGHFQGDGGTTHSVRYSTASKMMLNDFEALIYYEFPNCTVKHVADYDYTVVKKSGRFAQNGSQKNDVKEWLRDVEAFGKKSNDKRVPKCILEGSREEVSSFLSRFFGCDGFGNIDNCVRKSFIGCSLSSRGLVDDIRHLLLKYGIHANVSYSPVKYNGSSNDAWRLTIVRKSCLSKFEKEINIFSKEMVVNKVVEIARQRNDKSRNDFDNVPRGVWHRIFRLKDEKKVSYRSLLQQKNERLRSCYSVNRDKLYYAGESLEDSYIKGASVSDVKWDSVKNVSNVGMRQTVDLQVDPSHIIGGDIISHNTILASVISSYEAYKLLTINDGDPHRYYGLPDDDPFLILNAALSGNQASLLFEQTEARVRNSPFFEGKLAKSTTSEMRFFTKADIRKKAEDPNIEVRGSVIIRCGHSNPDTLRGPNAVLILFDELAFYDDSGKVTGQKFYDALQPSLTHFFPYGDGRLVEISSPSVQAGVFYDIFKRSKTDPHILSFQLPTWRSNPTIKYDGDYLVSKRNANPDSFRIEYGAQWAKSGVFGPYFPEGLINRGIEAGMRAGVAGPHTSRQPGYNYYLHVDPAYGGDKYVCVLVAKKFYKNRRGERRSKVQLAGIQVFEPEEGIGLRFNEIDLEIIRIARAYRCMAVTYDRWESIQSIQLLRSNGVNVHGTTFNNSYKQLIYQNLTDMLSYPDESELLLYDDSRLILEMKALKVRPIQRGKKFVTDKHGDVTTDDVVDCLAGATAMASGHVRMQLPEPVTVRMGFM